MRSCTYLMHNPLRILQYTPQTCCFLPLASLLSLVSFLPVCVTDKECMLLVLRASDIANGYALGNYASNERGYPLQLDTEEERQNLYSMLTATP